MENRRDFFRTLGAFAAGVVGAKVSSYIPKKEEKKEELMLSETITINHEGKLYHPLVVAKTPDSSSKIIENRKFWGIIWTKTY